MSLKVERIRAGMTVNEAAAQLYVSRSTLSYWEAGKRKVKAEDLKRMAQIYGCTVDDLLLDDIRRVNNAKRA